MDFDELLEQVEGFVTQLLKDRLSSQLYFHNVFHTHNVAKAAKEIGLHIGLAQKELAAVILAAWFHDTGYTEAYQNHELASAEIAQHFLESYGLEEDLLNNVKACIMATSYPQRPNNLMEMAICDADFFHFATENYLNQAQSLKREWEEKLDIHYSQQEWDRMNLSMLQNHQYFTAYGRSKLQEKKEKNIQRLLRVL